MSNQLLAALRDRRDIKGPGRAALMVLADHANERGECWLSYATIAHESGIGRSTARKHLKILRAAGEVTWTQRFDAAGDLDSNLYVVTMRGRLPDSPPRPQGATPTPPDGGGVGYQMAEGRPPGSHKAPIKPPFEATPLSVVPPDTFSLIEEKETPPRQDHVTDALWEVALQNSKTRAHSKKKVREAWEKIPKRERPPIEDAVKALKVWNRSEEWRKQDHQFARGLHLWIRDRQWENLPDSDGPAPSRYRNTPKPLPTPDEPPATAEDIAALMQPLRRRMNS